MSPEQGHVLGCGLSGSPGSDMSHRHLREHPGDPRRQDLLQAVRPDLHLHRVPGCGRPLARSPRPPSLCSLRGGGQLDLWKVSLPPSPPGHHTETDLPSLPGISASYGSVWTSGPAPPASSTSSSSAWTDTSPSLTQ